MRPRKLLERFQLEDGNRVPEVEFQQNGELMLVH